MELVGHYVIIATAGHDTTSNSIAGGLLALIEQPEQLVLLQEDPELIDHAADPRSATSCAEALGRGSYRPHRHFASVGPGAIRIVEVIAAPRHAAGTDRPRVVVVGAGVMGAAAAWRLAQRGADVTLLEQFGPGHERGASHGSSRIFRLAYAEPEYVRLAQRAHDGWRELEAATDAELLTITGAVDHGDPVQVAALHAALTDAAVDAEVLAPGEAERRFPGLRFDGDVLWHGRAGRLHADRAVAAFAAAAAGIGADVRHHEAVASIEQVDGITVTTASGLGFAADVVVVAAGGWSRRLLGGIADLPALRVTVEQPAHFTPLDPAMPWPTFIHHPRFDEAAAAAPGPAAAVYGLNSIDGVKVGFHKVGPAIDPDEVDRLIDGDRLVALQRYVAHWVPGVDPDTADPLTCTYTLTPDEHFVVDRDGPITVLAGFSGHGFKFAPAVGDLAADLALTDAVAASTFALGARPAVGDAPPPIR